MTAIRPFKGLTPKHSLAERVAAPLWDVLSAEQARTEAAANELSFLHVIRPENEFPPGAHPTEDELLQKSADNLQALLQQQVYVEMETPGLLVYRLTMGSHSQTGVVVSVAAAEYYAGNIKKHEHTRQDHEERLANHIDVIGAHTSPVFLIYRHQPEIDSLVSRLIKSDPVVSFDANDGVGHTLWYVDNEADVGRLIAMFDAVPSCYIADGHHRTAAAALVSKLRQERTPAHTGEEPYNFFLAVMFPDNQMQILDYNRCVRTLNGHTPQFLLHVLASDFDVEELGPGCAQEAKPKRPHEYGMLLGGVWYRIRLRSGRCDMRDVRESLDVIVLQNRILGPLLGIDDPRTNTDIECVSGLQGLAELERRCGLDCAVAFALYPTSIDHLIAIADLNDVMPPKSTSFEPKLQAGLILSLLD